MPEDVELLTKRHERGIENRISTIPNTKNVKIVDGEGVVCSMPCYASFGEGWGEYGGREAARRWALVFMEPDRGV